MDFTKLIETRRNRIKRIHEHISAAQQNLEYEEGVLEALVRLSQQEVYTLEDLNYLYERMNENSY
jgi:hypothetical protein